jgi:deoxyxylulose-5-phosphate synthase
MKISREVMVLGFEDEFTEHGDPSVLMQQYGLTATAIQKHIDDMWPVAQQASANLRRVV